MADKIELKVPDIGDFEGVEIIEVLVQPGESVAVDDALITLETEKATMEVPASAAGVIEAVKVKVGDTVSEGDLVAIITAEVPDGGASAEDSTESSPEPDVAETASGEEKAVEKEQAAQKPVTASAPSVSAEQVKPVPAAPSEGAAHAGPAVRRFARKLGVDLEKVDGSGRKGRVLKEDVESFVKKSLGGGGASQASGMPGLLPWPKVDFGKYGEIEVQALSRIQKLSGANLSRNWVMIPHVTQHDEADITEMEAFRKSLADEAKAEGIRMTPLAFLIKGVVEVLKQYPRFNASLDESGENLVLKKYFHIGIAVDTPNGLVVPVIRDCDSKGLKELATEMGEISVRAREGKLSPAEMQGGCFSISSLGGIGGTAFTPIINAPEVAILGVSRSFMKPVWDGREFQPRLMLPLSLSYDHRVIDGAAAARFTAALSKVLQDIRRMLL